tara:strand:+ start:410 stop:607 length:198 start_codon:yes stop_codon:yes gene_type:complete
LDNFSKITQKSLNGYLKSNYLCFQKKILQSRFFLPTIPNRSQGNESPSEKREKKVLKKIKKKAFR